MEAGKPYRIVLVTCGSLGEARKIAKVTVTKRLAACVNVVTNPVESVYWWKGRIETGREFLLLIKTTQQRLAKLEKEVKRLHSYDLPEFIVVPIAGGSTKYLDWVRESVKDR